MGDETPVFTAPPEQVAIQEGIAVGQAIGGAMFAVGSPLPAVLAGGGLAAASEKLVAAGVLSPFALKDGADKTPVAKNVTLAYTTDQNEANLRIGADGKFETKTGGGSNIWHKDLNLNDENPICKIYVDEKADKAKALESIKTLSGESGELNKYAAGFKGDHPIKAAASNLPKTAEDLQKAIETAGATPGSTEKGKAGKQSSTGIPENTVDVKDGSSAPGSAPASPSDVPKTETPEDTKKSGPSEPGDGDDPGTGSDGNQCGPNGCPQSGQGGGGGGRRGGGGGGDSGGDSGSPQVNEGEDGTDTVKGDRGDTTVANHSPWGVKDTASQAASQNLFHPLNHARLVRSLFSPQWQTRYAALSKALDTNGDGIIDEDEMKNATDEQKKELSSLDGEITEKTNQMAAQDPDSADFLKGLATQINDHSPSAANKQFHSDLGSLIKLTEQLDQGGPAAWSTPEAQNALGAQLQTVFKSKTADLDAAVSRHIIENLPAQVPGATNVRSYRNTVDPGTPASEKYEPAKKAVLDFLRGFRERNNVFEFGKK